MVPDSMYVLRSRLRGLQPAGMGVKWELRTRSWKRSAMVPGHFHDGLCLASANESLQLSVSNFHSLGLKNADLHTFS